MTAGDIDATTGRGRATVSSTLSKLAAYGDNTKAARGYQLRPDSDAAAAQSNRETGAPTDHAAV